jgi:hypothetical protein
MNDKKQLTNSPGISPIKKILVLHDTASVEAMLKADK